MKDYIKATLIGEGIEKDVRIFSVPSIGDCLSFGDCKLRVTSKEVIYKCPLENVSIYEIPTYLLGVSVLD